MQNTYSTEHVLVSVQVALGLLAGLGTLILTNDKEYVRRDVCYLNCHSLRKTDAQNEARQN